MLVLGCVGLMAGAGSLRADTIRSFELTADQVVPASASIAAGRPTSWRRR